MEGHTWRTAESPVDPQTFNMQRRTLSTLRAGDITSISLTQFSNLEFGFCSSYYIATPPACQLLTLTQPSSFMQLCVWETLC